MKRVPGLEAIKKMIRSGKVIIQSSTPRLFKAIRKATEVCVCCGYKHNGGATVSVLQCDSFTTKVCKSCRTCAHCCRLKWRHG